MTYWQRYLVTVTLGSDLHCGDRPLGFVARCHPFVPAHIPWYAAVAALVRLRKLPCDTASYQAVEDELTSTLRFSPFYITVGDEMLFPWMSDAAERIQTTWLGSQYGVSLFSDTRGAKKNRLFEIESILAVSRNGTPTRLRGVCYIKTDVAEPSAFPKLYGREIHAIVAHSVWGGQQNKGCGVLKDVRIESGVALPPEFGEMNQNEAQYPIIDLPPRCKSAYPLRYESSLANRVTGRMSPLTGRRFDPDKGPGLLAEPGTVVWEPGWHSTEDTDFTVCYSNRRYAESKAK